MTMKTILFADNHVEYLDTRVEFLERAGYSVIKAHSPEETRDRLEDTWAHILILDIRLGDDQDEEDTTGLELAQDPRYQRIPKIILTNYPSYEYVRTAMRRQPETQMSPAVDFLSKDEGPQAMIEAVEQSFSRMQINFDLEVQFTSLISLRDWARQIMGGEPSVTSLKALEKEIEALIRRLFFDYSDVWLDNIPLGGRREARAWASSRNNPHSGRRLLRIGTQQDIRQEQLAQEEESKYLGYWGLSGIEAKESLRFGALLYEPINPKMEPLQWLDKYSVSQDHVASSDAIRDLLEKCGDSLYSRPCEPVENVSLNLAYRKLVGLEPHSISQEHFQHAISDLALALRSRYLFALEHDRNSGSMLFHFPNGEQIQGLDPGLVIYQDLIPTAPYISWNYALGDMDGANILIDGDRKAWLVAFAFVGAKPWLNDFVALEAKLRFDWRNPIDSESLESLVSSESMLNDIVLPGLDHLEPTAVKNAPAIRTIRELAIKWVAASAPEYHLALLYYAAQRIVMGQSLDQRCRGLLAASMIAKNLKEQAPQ